MTAAFVVKVEHNEGDDLGQTAEDLLAVLQEAGIAVVSVDPWARPSTTPSLEDITRAAYAAMPPPAQAG